MTMRPGFRSFLLPLLAAGLVACGSSAPVRYYTLAPTGQGGGATAGTAVTLVVGLVELPAYVDRPQLAVRIGDGQLEFREFDRWAEPLEDGLTRALVQNLAELLPASRVIQFPYPARGDTDYRLLARVSRFEVNQNGEASLEAQWSVRGRGGAMLVAPRRDTFTRRAETADTAALVAAQSATVADLAAVIARVVADLRPPD